MGRKMKEGIRISKDEDKAIIMSLRSHPGVKLSSAQIANNVMKYIKIKNRNNLYKKIQRMAEKKYLLHCDSTGGNYIYYLNPDIEFILDGPDLKMLDDPVDGASPVQVEHSSVLKEAIRTWIDNLSEPIPGFPTIADSQGSSVIDACESHILFPDLTNHLPVLGIDVCSRWSEYKKELMQLDELKQNLISSLRTGILNCFEGLDLHFIYDSEHYLGEYECRLNPSSLYDVVLRLESGYEGYDNHMRFLSWLQCNAPIVEQGEDVLWGEIVTYIRVPKNDRASLEAGVQRFLVFFENITGSEFVIMSHAIIKKADLLKLEREGIIRSLEQALLYASFPGECQYLM